ncbi:MAG: hypothetical protein RI897_1831 [Verrucomicrobiota bacterium]|jgi:hypothetical protein
MGGGLREGGGEEDVGAELFPLGMGESGGVV